MSARSPVMEGEHPSHAGRRRVVARFVLAAGMRVLTPGVVEWDRAGRITSVRRARSREKVQEVAILPGLVNAHVHLQLGPLDRQQRRFLPWVGAVIRQRAQELPGDRGRRTRAHVRELLASGATALGEIDSSGESPRALLGLGTATRCYREVLGYDLDEQGARAAAAAAMRPPAPPPGRRAAPRRSSASDRLAPGLSPHAPYSVSASLFRAAVRSRRHLAVHCAELPEEQDFLRTGRGPFADLLRQLGRLPEGHRPPGCGAVRWLEQLGVLQPRTLLVHCQELERGDAGRIAGAGSPVVVCPGTIDYFRRSPPPVPAWLRRGIPVALGTDSRASNTALDMRLELRRAAHLWPTLSPLELLQMATEYGGRAIGLPVGRLARGRAADLLEVSLDAAASAAGIESLLAAFVQGELPLRRVLVAGRTVRR
ncbi:MAG: amidohydrolase family protein [Planctomycetota bacterium]